MYGYDEFIPLNEEEILKRVNQEDIVEMALGYKPVPYQRILNPLKKRDTRPGAWFEWFNGKLWLIDFGDQPTHRIAFKFISDYYNVSFIDALRVINDHFQLGLGQGQIHTPKPVIFHNGFQHANVEKQRTQILYKARPLQLRDKSSWFKYGITRDNLLEDQVLAGIWYKLWSEKLNKWIVIRPMDNFYIFSEFKEHVKILRPNAPVNHKWISNCDENDIFALDKLPPVGNICVVQKSYKDCRILRNHGLASIGLQNEGCLPTGEIVKGLIERFNEFPIFFDNDEAGLKAAIKVADYFNTFKAGIAYPLHLPLDLNPKGITDPGDLVLKRSQQDLSNFLTEKGLYESHT